MFVGISDYCVYSGEGGDLFRGALRITAGDYDLGFRIFSMNAADGGAGILVSGGGYGACVEDDNSSCRPARLRVPVPDPGTGVRWRRRRPESPGTRNSPRRRSPRFHSSVARSSVAWSLVATFGSDLQAAASTVAAEHELREAALSRAPSPRGRTPPADKIRLESGRREEEELAADSGIVYKFSIKIRPWPLAASAGNIPGRIPDVPALA